VLQHESNVLKIKRDLGSLVTDMIGFVKIVFIVVSAVVLQAAISASQLTMERSSYGGSREDRFGVDDGSGDIEQEVVLPAGRISEGDDHIPPVDSGLLPSADESEAGGAVSTLPRQAQMMPYAGVVVPQQSHTLRTFYFMLLPFFGMYFGMYPAMGVALYRRGVMDNLAR